MPGATHTSLGRRAAVKLLAPQLAENREYVSRFLSEARIVNAGRINGAVNLASTSAYDSTNDMFIDDGGVVNGAVRLGAGSDTKVQDPPLELTEETVVWRGKKNCVRVVAA